MHLRTARPYYCSIYMNIVASGETPLSFNRVANLTLSRVWTARDTLRARALATIVPLSHLWANQTRLVTCIPSSAPVLSCLAITMFSSPHKFSRLYLPIIIGVTAFFSQVFCITKTSQASIQSRQTVSVPEYIKINGKMNAVTAGFSDCDC